MEPDWITEKNEASESRRVAALQRDYDKAQQQIKALKKTIWLLKGQLANRIDIYHRWTKKKRVSK